MNWWYKTYQSVYHFNGLMQIAEVHFQGEHIRPALLLSFNCPSGLSTEHGYSMITLDARRAAETWINTTRPETRMMRTQLRDGNTHVFFPAPQDTTPTIWIWRCATAASRWRWAWPMASRRCTSNRHAFASTITSGTKSPCTGAFKRWERELCGNEINLIRVFVCVSLFIRKSFPDLFHHQLLSGKCRHRMCALSFIAHTNTQQNAFFVCLYVCHVQRESILYFSLICGAPIVPHEIEFINRNIDKHFNLIDLIWFSCFPPTHTPHKLNAHIFCRHTHGNTQKTTSPHIGPNRTGQHQREITTTPLSTLPCS